jgi:uncharacterized membrane protein
MLWFSTHWVLVISIFLGIYVLSPFLAPVLMSAGLTLPGKIIYGIYSFLCHQLPERSYFLFGSKISYSIGEIQSVWKNTNEIAVLRQFVGDPQMGWKVAWSDRMISMFTSLWVFGILWGLYKKKMRPLPWWGLVLLLLPMAIDGTTHFFSDLAGLGQGYRDSNAWLATLTSNALAPSFYAGDAWGSFNAWMRLITGVLFGLGIVWFGFPYLDEAFTNSAQVVEYKYQYRSWLQNEKERLVRLSLTTESEQRVGVENAPGDRKGDD